MPIDINVTCPRGDVAECMREFKHIAPFMSSACMFQIEDLWVRVAREGKAYLQERPRPMYLSTSGTGVFYLHVRLDDVPKYYIMRSYFERVHFDKKGMCI